MELHSDSGLFNVRPPRLEDAGLEDTVLPAHAIQEAFNRAADALHTASRHVHSTAVNVHSTAVNNFGGVHIHDEERGKSFHGYNAFEELTPNWNGSSALGEGKSCVDTKAGGLVEEGHDLFVGQDTSLYGSDKVEFGKQGVPQLGDKGCVEGLPGDRGEEKVIKDEAEDGPILVLA